MARHPSIHPFEIDPPARTRVTESARPPATRLGNAILHGLWHGWRLGRRAALDFALARQVSRERHVLAGLDERELADIGVDRATARDESRRAFLDLPGARRR